MTDNEIIKALGRCRSAELTDCEQCPYWNNYENCLDYLMPDTLSLINRQKAEIEELVYKLECLLCHATGSKLSKHTYPLNTMYSAVNDEVQDCCDDARAEAIKEFAERLKTKASDFEFGKAVWVVYIDNLVKEMVGDTDGV